MAVSPSAVLWDMDGTLVDSEKVWTAVLRDVAGELGGRMSDETRATMIGMDMSCTLFVMLDEVGLPATPANLRRTEDLLNTRAMERFEAGLQWRPGALAALRMVRAAGWRTALVTNTGRELAEKALDGIGREHFDVTVCGDEVDRGKPEPDPYLRAAALLGVDPQDCVAIEDSPTGALAAERAGMAVLVVPCEQPVPEGPMRVLRESLVGLTADELRLVHTGVQSARAA